jgi:hypothetical protein
MWTLLVAPGDTPYAEPFTPPEAQLIEPSSVPSYEATESAAAVPVPSSSGYSAILAIDYSGKLASATVTPAASASVNATPVDRLIATRRGLCWVTTANVTFNCPLLFIAENVHPLRLVMDSKAFNNSCASTIYSYSAWRLTPAKKQFHNLDNHPQTARNRNDDDRRSGVVDRIQKTIRPSD